MVMVGAAFSCEFIVHECAPAEIFKYVWIDFKEYTFAL